MAGHAYRPGTGGVFGSFAWLKPTLHLGIEPNHRLPDLAALSHAGVMACDRRFYPSGSKHKTHQPKLELRQTSKRASHVAPGLFNQGRGRSLRCRSAFAAPFIVVHL